MADRLYVSGVGVHLPEPVDASVAQAAGDTDLTTIRRTGVTSVCVSSLSGPDMAVRAGRAAMRHGGTRPDDIDLMLHASTYFQGHDLWAAASYVQRQAVGNACLSLQVDQLSNGGMAALELATAYLRADRRRHSALITTGDRFCKPGFDRWNTDPGTVCGDAGTALVVSRRTGPAELLSLVTISDPELESMGRGDAPFAEAALTARTPISVEAHRALLLKRLGVSNLIERLQQGQRDSLQGALTAAGVDAATVDWHVVPHLGRPKMQFQFFDPLKIDMERSTWPWGRTVGHLGAGDQFAGLEYLARTGRLACGQIVALIGAGGGFAWSTAILRIVATPAALSSGDPVR